MPEKTDHLTVTVDLTAEMNVINPFDFFLEPEAEVFPFAYAPEVLEDLKPFFQKAEVGPALPSLSRRPCRAPKSRPPVFCST